MHKRLKACMKVSNRASKRDDQVLLEKPKP